MSSEVKERECDRVRTVVGPALHHLIRLESYFRLHDFETVSVHLEAALNELERLIVSDDVTVGDSDDVLAEVDQDQSLYNAG